MCLSNCAITMSDLEAHFSLLTFLNPISLKMLNNYVSWNVLTNKCKVICGHDFKYLSWIEGWFEV